MASQVEIIRNYPRTELLKDGWSKSRLAGSMKTAKFDSVEGVFKPGVIPDELWREPNTGVIMLKPSAIRSDFWEDAWYDTHRMPLSSWSHSSTANNGLLAMAHNNSIVTVRPDTSTAVVEVLVDTAISAILAEMSSSMRFVMQTKDPLVPNEGWTVIVHPPGIYTERATDYMLIAFGGRYCLHLRMDGTASLWSYNGSWKERVQFKYSGGGVEHGKAFQITVIPWGFSYLTFLFSQSSEPNSKERVVVASERSNTFLYDIQKYEGDGVVDYDNPSHQWIKTQQGPISVAVRSVFFQYGFAFAKVRYRRSGELVVFPEHLPEVLDQQAPSVTVRGFKKQFTPAGYYTDMSVVTVNETNVTFNKNTDTQIVNKITLDPSGDYIYTPELWSIDVEIPPKTHTPGWTPEYSTNWTYLRFQRTTDPQQSVCNIKFTDDSYSNLLRGWGPVRINVEGVTCFDGYITQKMPTLEPWFGMSGTEKAHVSSQVDAKDMWLRLDEKHVDDYKFIDGLGILDTIKSLIRKCGFEESDIEVSDPGGYLAALTFEGFIDPNDQKGFSPDALVGDVLREILKNFSLYPIRVRSVGGKWQIYLEPQYNPSTPPTTTFYLQSNPTLSDVDRWAASQFYVLSNLEFKVEEPEFNGLIAVTSDGSTNGAEGVQVVIPATLVDGDSVTNTSSFWFTGRFKGRKIAPPEITMAQTSDELKKIARVYWARHSKHRFMLEFRGEWNPSIDVDQFIWVIGIDNGGNRVSYGAWRIMSLDVEGQYDFKDDSANPDNPRINDNPDMRWTWQANYTLEYVGVASGEDTPMFTTTLP